MRLQSPVSISMTTLCGIPSKPCPLPPPPPPRSPGFLFQKQLTNTHTLSFSSSICQLLWPQMGWNGQWSFSAPSVPSHTHFALYTMSCHIRRNMAVGFLLSVHHCRAVLSPCLAALKCPFPACLSKLIQLKLRQQQFSVLYPRNGQAAHHPGFYSSGFPLKSH